MSDNETRWKNYRLANTSRPQARERELYKLFNLLEPKKGERIWEAGTGNGYLTFPIAEEVGERGEVVTTDVEEGNIADMVAKHTPRTLPITALLLPVGAPSLGKDHRESFDAVASIATLHHFDNRREGSGERGRRAALRAFYEALKPGGRPVIADGPPGTISQ